MASCVIASAFAVGSPSGPSGIPVGHTRASWQSCIMKRPYGHTAYSWLHAAHDAVEASGAVDAASRLESAELRASSVRTNMKSIQGGVSRVKAELEHGQVKGAVLWEVDPTYYDWELAERARCLKSPIETLCKSIILVNSGLPDDAPVTDDPSTSKFIVVVLQYVSKLDTDRLAKSLKLGAPKGFKCSHKLAVASPEDSSLLTDFGHNAVSPFGCATKLPMVVSRAVKELQDSTAGRFLWLGGGHVDVKLRLPVSELLRPGVCGPVGAQPRVLACTELRDPADTDEA